MSSATDADYPEVPAYLGLQSTECVVWSRQWPLLEAPYKIPKVDMYKFNAKSSWFRRDDDSNFAGNPSAAASVQGSTNPTLDRDQIAMSDAGPQNASAVVKLNAVNRISVVSSILELLSSPQAQEAFTPLRRGTNSQTGEHTQRLIIPPVRVTTGSFTDVCGNARGVMTFAVTAAQEEDLHQFFCRAAYVLCNFCNMYILSVLASHTLCKVTASDSPEDVNRKLGIALKLCTQTDTCTMRDLDHYVSHKVTHHCTSFFIPGNAILHEILALSLQKPSGILTIVLRAEIPDSLLTAEHLKFVRGNVQALRTMLQASQVLQLYRYLLAANAGGDEHQQAAFDLQMQQFVSRTPYNLGAICALTYYTSQSKSRECAKNPALMGYIFVYGKNAPDLNSCAFPITEKATRTYDMVLHRIRGDLLYVQELPDVFPYHIAVDNGIQIDAELSSHFAKLGLYGQRSDATSGCLSLSVVKNDPNSEPSVEHLAKFINLMSSCRRLCSKRFTIVLAVNFQVKQDSNAQSQHSGTSRWALLESTLGEQPLALTATKQVEEELQLIFSNATGQSSLMCTLGSFLPVVRSTGAELNTLVECVMFVREKARVVPQIAAASVVAPVNQEHEHVPNASAADCALAVAEEYMTVFASQPWDVQDGHAASIHHVRVGRSMSLSRMCSEPALSSAVTLTEKSRSVTDLAQESVPQQIRQNAPRFVLPTAQFGMGNIPGHTSGGGTQPMQATEPAPPAVCQQEAAESQDGILARIAAIVRRIISALTPNRDEPSERPDSQDSAAGDPTAPDTRAACAPESEAYTQWVEQQLRMDGSGAGHFGVPARAPQTLEIRPSMEGRNAPTCPPVRDVLLALLASMSCKIFMVSALAAILIAAIYVGVIRSRCVTHLASCDIAVASGLPCTLILILLCSLTVEYLLRNRQQDTLQEPSVAPAVPVALGATR
ncbi:hypothetical protein BKM88_05205 [Anaplasma marginale]|uniref:hypothetical protein n=1 Tax=Anaplasma marginale TaxID=770 RepID=UPI000E56B7EA|nr:hypothetical protein [Anaplasma marginale]AXW85429.1 hypothetical protein BKM88_05205 [Anaplasma marginale]